MTSFESREIAIVTGSNRGIGFACLKDRVKVTKTGLYNNNDLL